MQIPDVPQETREIRVVKETQVLYMQNETEKEPQSLLGNEEGAMI